MSHFFSGEESIGGFSFLITSEPIIGGGAAIRRVEEFTEKNAKNFNEVLVGLQ